MKNFSGGVARTVRMPLLVIKPDIVGFGDVRQAIDGVEHLRQAAFVLLIHGGQQIHGLSQSLVPFREFFDTFIECHGAPIATAVFSIITAWRRRHISSIQGSYYAG